MTKIASRLKDVLWSIRRRYGMETDIDQCLPLIVFERIFTQDQLDNLFITYSKRTPEDFKSALLNRIRQAVCQYMTYLRSKKGYHKVLKCIVFLENVVRYGLSEGCRLVFDENTGYILEIKPEHLKKEK